MIDVIAIISFITTALALQKVYIHYFQMNRYETKLSCKMLISNYIVDYVLIGLMDVLNFILFINYYNTAYKVISIIGIIYKIYLGWLLNMPQKQKTKLKYTWRVIRWLIILAIIYIGSIMLLIVYDNKLTNLTLMCFAIANIIALGISKTIEYIYQSKYKYAAIKALRNHPNLTVIGITGSYGKTSVKEYLYSILKKDKIVLATPKSYNTLMGVCKFINSVGLDNVEYLIVEMGAVRRYDIQKLCNLVHPQIGIIASIGNQHLDTFGSLENIYKTKNELADYLVNSNGTIIYNLNDKNCYNAWDNCIGDKIGVYVNNTRGYDNNILIGNNSLSNIVNIYNIEKTIKNMQNISYNDTKSNKVVYLSTILLGEHNLQNIALAVSCSRLLGVKADSICDSVSSLKAVDNRLQPKTGANGAMLIMDAYNSNEHSFISMLKTISGFNVPNKILITPGVVELGDKQFDVNYRLGTLSADVFSEVWVINKVNKYALTEGLKSSKSNCTIKTFDRLDDDIFTLVNTLDDSYLVVFENDLPDSYK